MESDFDARAVRSLVERAADRLSGEWLLVGGAVASLWFRAERRTEDIDLVPLDPDPTQRLALLDFAIQEALPVETLNSAADFFVRRVPGWRREIVLLHRGASADVYRPTATLFLLLKLSRLSPTDLDDCLALLRHCRVADETIDTARVVEDLDGLSEPPTAQLSARRQVLRSALVDHAREPGGNGTRDASDGWLGIDFSGDHTTWRPKCTKSNVWIATVRPRAGVLVVSDLRRVQELDGAVHPFDRLTDLLRRGDFRAAGIDAPFSVPRAYVDRGYPALLRRVAELSPGPERPFADGDSLVRDLAPAEKKPLRRTESLLRAWSTLWSGPRGGAPMTAACMRLLHAAGRPIWPWERTGPGLLVEAYPAAQLRQWGLPRQKYAGRKDGAPEHRLAVLKHLEDRRGVCFEAGLRARAADSADALDAVLCAFAAIAVTTSAWADPIEEAFATAEGWIAVHR